jgi:hypothetical protein
MGAGVEKGARNLPPLDFWIRIKTGGRNSISMITSQRNFQHSNMIPEQTPTYNVHRSSFM